MDPDDKWAMPAGSNVPGMSNISRLQHQLLGIMAPVEITIDYYATLEITQIARDDEIRTSYKRLARVRHPDKNVQNPNATAEFQLVGASVPASTSAFHPQSQVRKEMNSKNSLCSASSCLFDPD